MVHSDSLIQRAQVTSREQCPSSFEHVSLLLLNCKQLLRHHKLQYSRVNEIYQLQLLIRIFQFITLTDQQLRNNY